MSPSFEMRSTQTTWQAYTDRKGGPWLAIVVDPLRSLAKGTPELGAFRVYVNMPTYMRKYWVL